MKKITLVLAVLLPLAYVAYRAYEHGAHREGAAHVSGYYCPMHPSYTSDRPGDCPICNMKLVPMEEESAPEEAAPSGKILYYRHPMRPEVTSPVPRKDEMGMDYVPVYSGEDKAEVPVEGQAVVRLSAERRQMIGMKSEPVRRRRLAATVRASGRVAYDPELYSALAEHREAVKAGEKLKDSPWPQARERAEALARASALRLRQLGLSERQIEEGVSAERLPTNLLPGGSGDTVWVYAQIYEYEIGLVKPGQIAEIETPAYPGRKFRGRVKALDPILSAETRSLKVRIEVPNREGLLRLEMYVDAVIRADLGWKLALPEEAVLDSGERKIVFVDLGDGRIEPREVRVGRQAGGYFELLSGVKPGEKVVTAANFLIDSESKLKAALSGIGGKSGKTPERRSP